MGVFHVCKGILGLTYAFLAWETNNSGGREISWINSEKVTFLLTGKTNTIL